MEKVIWRRFYAVKGLEVSKNGGVRRTMDDARSWDGNGTPKKREWHIDDTGNVYVEIRKPKRMNLRVDMLVATCFWGKPREGQRFVIHKNRDKKSCWADNLLWATPYEYGEFYADDPTVNTSDGFRLVLDGIYVSRQGEVKVNGVQQKICDSFFDPDIDREAAVNPFVYVQERNRRNRIYIEEMVASAYLPKPFGLGNPVLMHKDMDYKNCALDNLAWVEYQSEEYQQYLTKRKADIEKRVEELNPHDITHLLIGKIS